MTGQSAMELMETHAKALEAEVKRLEALVYVPGLWRCAKCECEVVSTEIHAHSGRMRANKEPQTCPNDCGPMWRVTERDAGNEMVRRCERLRAVALAAKSLASACEDHGYRCEVPEHRLVALESALEAAGYGMTDEEAAEMEKRGG